MHYLTGDTMELKTQPFDTLTEAQDYLRAQGFTPYSLTQVGMYRWVWENFDGDELVIDIRQA